MDVLAASQEWWAECSRLRMAGAPVARSFQCPGKRRHPCSHGELGCRRTTFRFGRQFQEGRLRRRIRWDGEGPTVASALEAALYALRREYESIAQADAGGAVMGFIG